jgi:hypothetical protein
VFDRLGFPEARLPEGPAIEASTEPEARTETDAPSSISVSIARSNAPLDRVVVWVAAEALRVRLGLASIVRETDAVGADEAEAFRDGDFRTVED